MALSNVRLYADTCALYAVENEAEDVGVWLDDFDLPIPDDFRGHSDAWYASVPTYGDLLDNLEEVNDEGRRLADELASLIGQPVTYG
jgi:hypothetical protein